MPSPEIEEFARTLVRHVRDATVRNCDGLLQPQANSPVAQRWRSLGASASDLGVIVPDAVDETIFSLLQAIDQGLLRLKFVTSTGREIDLTDEDREEIERILPVGWAWGDRYDDAQAGMSERYS